MRIDRLVLASFGAFADAAVDFSPGLNLFFGENEGGKSTLIDGLLLALLGAASNSGRRQRYIPLDRPAYAATIHLTTADGRSLRIERDLAPGGQDKVGILEDGTWVIGRKSESILKALALPSFDLARATAVISGSEVVLAARDEARTVSKAISARITQDETSVSGQQALRRLGERRVLLENKERKALEEGLKTLQRMAEELGGAHARESDLEKAKKEAQERLAEARGVLTHYGPAIEALTALTAARAAYEEISARHIAVFTDLRAIREKEEEIARVEREMAPLLPVAESFEGAILARYQQLVAMVRARQEAAAFDESEISQLQADLQVMREKYALYQRAGFTAERQRELDRIDGAVGLAEKNLAEKEAALASAKEPGRWSAALLAVSVTAILAGLAAGIMGIWPGWLAVLSGSAVILAVIVRRGRWAGRCQSLREAREKAVKEVDLAKAALFARSGGRELADWQAELAAAQQLTEEIRTKEIQLQAKTGRTPQAVDEEAELSALLAAAGCLETQDYETKARTWGELRRRLEEARTIGRSLMRDKSRPAWEESELDLARQEAVAKAVLSEAEKAAAGLDPVAVARYREELAHLDLAALEREAAAAAAALAQHRQSGVRHDQWEIETGLALAETSLGRNRRRSGSRQIGAGCAGPGSCGGSRESCSAY